MNRVKPKILLLSLAFALVGCGGTPAAAEISAFDPPEGALGSGSPAPASVRVKNPGTEDQVFWLGYSVQDPSGEWHDAPPGKVKLGPGEESDTYELSTGPLETPGYYKARVSVWDVESEEGKEATRLAVHETAFRVYSAREDFGDLELDAERWEATSRKLGQGELAPENVGVEDGQLRLTLPAGTLDGGEISSGYLYGPGFYAARIKVPKAPSSITGFFLYEPPDFESEIDVEIFNDPSGRVMFTTYAGGERTHTENMILPFDPTEDFHNYAFFYDENSVTFYVDGGPMTTYEGGLPEEPMKLYVNTWFPDWLAGEKPPSDRHVYVDWIEY